MTECQAFGRLIVAERTTGHGHDLHLVCARCGWTEQLPEAASLEEIMNAEIHHIGYDQAAAA